MSSCRARMIFNILFLASWIPTSFGVSSVGCPDVAFNTRHYLATFGNTCYVFINTEKFWNEARDYCWWLGGELVHIHNMETMEFLKSILDSKELGWNKNGVWIGASDDAKEGRWIWTTGEEVTWSYWAKGQPRTWPFSISIEDCAQMRKSEGWRWHDYSCNLALYHYNSICQFPLITTSTTTTTTTTTVSSTVARTTTTRTLPVQGLFPAISIHPNTASAGNHRHGVIMQRMPTVLSDSKRHRSFEYSAVKDEALKGSSWGKPAPQSAKSEDTGISEGNVLGIVISLAAAVIIIMALIMYFYRRWLKKKYVAKEPAVLFQNTSYAQIHNDADGSTSSTLAANNSYWNTNKVNMLYEKVNKQMNHGVNNIDSRYMAGPNNLDKTCTAEEGAAAGWEKLDKVNLKAVPTMKVKVLNTELHPKELQLEQEQEQDQQMELELEDASTQNPNLNTVPQPKLAKENIYEDTLYAKK